MSFNYKSWNEILGQYVSSNIIPDIDYYMGIFKHNEGRKFRCVRWFNFQGKLHRKMGPAEIILSPDKQKLWYKHGEKWRSNDLPCHVLYYETGELQSERWNGHNSTYMSCAIWYYQNGQISDNLLCLSNTHVHEKNWLDGQPDLFRFAGEKMNRF